jgi:hypothetical protein
MTTQAAFDELLGAQTALADAIEALQEAQTVLADATVELGEESGLLTA